MHAHRFASGMNLNFEETIVGKLTEVYQTVHLKEFTDFTVNYNEPMPLHTDTLNNDHDHDNGGVQWKYTSSRIPRFN